MTAPDRGADRQIALASKGPSTQDSQLEALSTGDILVLATYDMDIVHEWCTRAIRLDAGRVVADGPVAELMPKAA